MELLEVAESLAGRPITVQKTRMGQYAVEWFNFNTMPPPPGNTEEEALENFIAFMEGYIKENKDAVDRDVAGEANTEDEGSVNP